MAEVRALGFKIGLHTGGPYPGRLSPLLPLVDWIGLDIKALPEDYPLVTGVPGSGERAWRSLRLLLDAGVNLEVRTTPMPGLDDRGYLGQLMEELARTGVRNYALQRCRETHLLDSPVGRPSTKSAGAWIAQPFEHFQVRGV
jgi:pyruvate formate lyase activating enzyme